MDEIRIKLIKEPKLEYNAITTPAKAVEMIQDLIGDSDREHFISVNIDNAGIPINYNVVAIGTETSAQVSISNVLKGTLLSGANALLIFHNHPSGKLSPSKEDVLITNKMQSACKLMDINLLDHIIVSSDDYFSFKNNGLLNDVSNLQVNDMLFSSVAENNNNYTALTPEQKEFVEYIAYKEGKFDYQKVDDNHWITNQDKIEDINIKGKDLIDFWFYNEGENFAQNSEEGKIAQIGYFIPILHKAIELFPEYKSTFLTSICCKADESEEKQILGELNRFDIETTFKNVDEALADKFNDIVDTLGDTNFLVDENDLKDINKGKEL